MYRGEEVGEGGYVYAEPGIYYNVALLDIASMHPSSIVAENLFGNKYTKKFKQLLDIRLMIKHEEFDKLGQMFDGKLKKYLTNTESASALSKALKIPINSVYGLTSAKFPNPFRDPRNVDNIVAKRGALFMINLKHEVQARGYTVAHIKTDSIKIPNATPEIIEFCMDFARMYGYEFEHECTYERMCLVNDAVYIAKYASQDTCMNLYGYIPGDNQKKAGKWTATGAQFQVPYVFKTLFSKEPLEFSDYCETKSVAKGALYLKNGEDNYSFIGRVGQFTPMKEGVGKELLVLRDDKYTAPPGTKGYYWLESEYVREHGLEDEIDISYYENMAAEAARTIAAYAVGGFDEFMNGQLNTEFEGEELPFAE
jgi:hypothetical protein